MGCKRLVVLVVLAILVGARPAHAGWLDFIWEMTGPRMIGIGLECEVAIKRDAAKGCVTPFGPFPRRDSSREGYDPWFWVSTEAFYYFSRDSEAFTSNGVRGFGIDPMIVFSRIKDAKYPSKSVRVTVGAGLTLQRFWSDDFEAFGNSGFKFRPLAVEFPVGGPFRLNIAYNLRYYWDGFEAIPAGQGTPAVFRKADQPETVHGLGFTLTF